MDSVASPKRRRRLRRAGVAALVLIGSVAVLTRHASAHHPEITVSARCGTASPVMAWTTRSWITYDSPHAYNPDIEVDIQLANGSWQQIGRGAFNLANSFQFTGTYDLPTSVSGSVYVRAIAIGSFGLHGEFGSAGSYRIASTTVPNNCGSGGTAIVCGGTLGSSADYNLFVGGDVNLVGSDVHGRIAAGGNVTLTNYGIGNALTVNSSRVDLAAGGSITGSAVNVHNGSVNFGTGSVAGVSTPHGVISQADGSWIASSMATLAASSTAWAAAAPNMQIAWVNPSYKTLELVGTDPKTNIFSIPANDLATAREIHLKAPANATILINVTGVSYSAASGPLTAVALWNGTGYSQYSYPSADANAINYRTQVLWNFPQATSVQFGPSVNWEGSVLAPYAAVALPGGQLNGELIAASASNTTAGSTELHPFKPAVSCLPPTGPTTPGPTTPPTGPTTPGPTTPTSGTTIAAGGDTFCTSYGSVAGSVFDDHNANGVRDGGSTSTATDRGVAGVTATAYDSTGASVGSATTDANGAYKISITASASTYLRVEFTNLPAGYQPGANTATGSNVQFVRICDTDINFAVQIPTHYCQDNPDLAASCQRKGVSTKPAVMTQKWSAGWDAATSPMPPGVAADEYDTGYPDGAGTTTGHPVSVPADAIGSVSSMTWRPATRTIYTAAYVKAGATLGPAGAGGIYAINLGSGSSASSASVLTELPVAASGAPTLATDGTPTNFDDAMRTGLGGMALVPGATASEDVLYVIGLADRKLYAITNLDGARNVTSVALPTSLPGAAQGCAANDVRAFAVTAWDGGLFIAMTCTAESTQDASQLRAYVYSYDAGSGFGASPALEFPLTYNRGELDYFGFSHLGDGFWHPWSSATTVVQDQVIVSGLAITEGQGSAPGNLIVGLRSRAGDMTLDSGSSLYYLSEGDVLLANRSGAGWAIESDLNATTPGEYFFQDRFPLTPLASGKGHFEAAKGTIEAVPGFSNVAVTQLTNYNTSGITWQSPASGRVERAMSLYSSIGQTDTFGKTNSLGDLVALCDQAPIEVGDRIWADVNDNGIQDANEHGLAGVQVTLTKGTAVVANATTDAWGMYTFPKLAPNTAYQISVDEAQAPLGTVPQLAKSAQGTDPNIDSNATEFVNGASKSAVLTFTTGAAGANDHSLDIGFVRPNPVDPPPVCTTCDAVTTPTTLPPKTGQPPVTFFNP